jgi:hypothetical protein
MTSRLVQLHAAAAACLRTWAAASNQLLITFTALASAYTACGVSSECLHRGLPQSVKQRPYACQGVFVSLGQHLHARLRKWVFTGGCWGGMGES